MNTYEITLDIRGNDLTVTLTQPNAFEVLFGNLQVPGFLDYREKPKNAAERQEYEQFARDLIMKVSDLPMWVVELLPAGELAKLIYASANVFSGKGPRMGEYNPGEAETTTEDANALAANAYPHFSSSEENVDGESRAVARGE